MPPCVPSPEITCVVNEDVVLSLITAWAAIVLAVPSIWVTASTVYPVDVNAAGRVTVFTP